MKPYKVEQKKWDAFTKEQQLQNIAAELARATKAELHNNRDWRQGAYERAINLIDAAIESPQWENRKLLYQLRDAVAALYIGKADPAITNFIYSQLLMRNN